MAQSSKVKITINFDADILGEIKKMANDMGAPYQTLLNKIVKDSLKRKKAEESRLDRLEKEIKALKKKDCLTWTISRNSRGGGVWSIVFLV